VNVSEVIIEKTPVVYQLLYCKDNPLYILTPPVKPRLTWLVRSNRIKKFPFGLTQYFVLKSRVKANVQQQSDHKSSTLTSRMLTPFCTERQTGRKYLWWAVQSWCKCDWISQDYIEQALLQIGKVIGLINDHFVKCVYSRLAKIQ
jgi:hypothetical protein